MSRHRKFLVALALLCGLAFEIERVAAAELAPNAPEDKPRQVSAGLYQRFIDDTAPSVAIARASYPQARARYLAGLPPGERFMVTTRLNDERGAMEQVFVDVDSIADGRVRGRIASEIVNVHGFKQHDAISFPESDIVDWTITKPDGSEEGNFVGKFLDAYDPPDTALSESLCAVITQSAAGYQTSLLPSLHVLEATARPGPFVLPQDAPPQVNSIMCARSSVVPGPNDYKVLEAGYPFYISAGAEATRRLFVLERSEGRYRLRATQGELTPAEQEAVQRQLNGYTSTAGENPPTP